MKIALVSLASFGDCINSTMMFQPIKRKWLGCQLDIHTTTTYGSAYDGNPHADAIIKHPCNSKDQAFSLYNVIPQRLHGYDKILVPAPILHHDWWTSRLHPELGHNIICTFMRAMEEENIAYDYPVSTTLILRPEEIQRARALAARGAGNGKRKVLMEVQGLSGQTHWDDGWTDAIGQHLMPNHTLFISGRDHSPVTEKLVGHGAIWAGYLSIRECTELYNCCDIFLSVSSGLSCACNTSRCRTDLKWLEMTNSKDCDSSPLRSAGKIFYHNNDVGGYIKVLDDMLR